MNDKQFDNAFTSAGGWFILTQYEEIAAWKSSTTELVDYMFSKGFDSKRSGTRTRVSSVLRLIDKMRIKEALEKIRDSKRINQQHLEAEKLAVKILKERF